MASSSTSTPSILETMPQEILEYIAYFVGTSELKGPPTDLVQLCRTSSHIYAAVALQHTPSIYADIFRAKFDVQAPMRRFGRSNITTKSLVAELHTRFTSLQRFRDGTAVSAVDLWMAVFLMFENAGKNIVHLRDYGVDAWLQNFLLNANGESGVMRDMERGRWPRDSQETSLALWLLWLICEAEGLQNETLVVRKGYSEVLRTYALGAPKYPVTHQSWVAFSRVPGFPPWERVEYMHYGMRLKPTPPAIPIPAILGYITRKHELQRTINPTTAPAVDPSLRWESDWARCVGASNVHRPGALEGAWEGPFTYTEFSVYAAILSGGSPHLLHDGAIGRNLQVWRLREYHLYAEDPNSLDMLPPGDVLDAFFPPDSSVAEAEDHVSIKHSSKDYVYTRAVRNMTGGVEETEALCDAVIFGEGHSSWGNFRLSGRVRTSDAFVTVLKEYNGGDHRGRWLYRGYLVGGKLTGRWRDSFSPSTMNGYEGCFVLSQRV